MIEIKTLVYFDIEATGLKSSGRQRISEITFVAINTQEILNLHPKLMENLNYIKNSWTYSRIGNFITEGLEQAHLMCLSSGNYIARGIQTYWFGQL